MRLITESGEIIPVSDRQVIGRDLFKSKIISKAHGVIWLEGKSIFYKDTGSLHGSFLVENSTGRLTRLTPEPVEIVSGFKLQLSKHLKIRDKVYSPVIITVEADKPSNVFSANFSDISENLDNIEDDREGNVNYECEGEPDDEERKHSVEDEEEGERMDEESDYYEEPNQTGRSDTEIVGTETDGRDQAESSLSGSNSEAHASDLLLRFQIAHLEDKLTAQSSTLDSLGYDLKELRLQSLKNDIISKRLQIAKRKEAFRFAKIKTNKLKRTKSPNLTEKTAIKLPAEYKQSLTAGIVGGVLGVSLGAAATITFLLNLD